MLAKKVLRTFLAVGIAALLAIPATLLSNPSIASAADTYPLSSLTNDTKGSATIANVRDNERFIATRIIETSYDGHLSRTFADGFSYGNNGAHRYDNGLSAYLSLTDETAKKNAVEAFSKQITDKSEQYATVAQNGVAHFDSLPMGQYIIVGVPSDASRVYQKMVANIEPTIAGNTYSMIDWPVTTKFDTITITKPSLEIEASADEEEVVIGSPIKFHIEVTPGDGSETIRNVHVIDTLDPGTIDTGMILNQDVKVTDQDGNEIENASITYTVVNGETIGFTIDIPGEFPADTKFFIDFTGDTSNIEDDAEITNIAKVWCDDVEPIEDVFTIKVSKKLVDTGDEPMAQEPSDDSNVADEKQEATPIAEKIVELFQTGDIIPYLIGSAIILAIAGGVIYTVRRRRNR